MRRTTVDSTTGDIFISVDDGYVRIHIGSVATYFTPEQIDTLIHALAAARVAVEAPK